MLIASFNSIDCQSVPCFLRELFNWENSFDEHREDDRVAAFQEGVSFLLRAVWTDDAMLFTSVSLRMFLLRQPSLREVQLRISHAFLSGCGQRTKHS